jgi:CHAT domain-containing protein/tetratricopeptide (TPR) repeat protein
MLRRLPLITALLLPLCCPGQTIKERLDEAFRLIGTEKMDDAQRLLRDVIPDAVNNKDLWAEAEARRGLGQIYNRQARFQESRNELGRALPLYQAIGDRLGAGRTYSDMAYIEWAANNRPKARELYTQAIKEFEAVQSLADKANALYNLVFTSQDRKEMGVWVEEGFALATRIGNRRIEGQFLHVWGDLLFIDGDFAGAIQKLEQAIPRLEGQSGAAALARALTSLGRVYRAHGLHEKALAQYQRALALQEKAGDRLGMVQSLNSIGTAHAWLGNRKEEGEYMQRALELARQTGSLRYIQSQQMRLANAYIRLGKYAAAIEMLKEPLAGDGFLGEEPWRIAAYAYQGLKQYPLALEAAGRAVELSERNYVERLPEALWIRALIKKDVNDPEGVLADVKRALQAVEQQRRRAIPTDEMKRGFADQNQKLFRLAVETLHQLGRHSEAIETVEQARGRAFLDLLASREPLLKPEDQTQLAVLRNSDPQPLQSTAAIAVAMPVPSRGGGNQTGDFKVLSSSGKGELRSFVAADPHSVAEMATTAARLHSTIVAYWVNPEAIYMWVVTADGNVNGARVEVASEDLARTIRQTWSGQVGGGTRGAPEQTIPMRGGESVTLSQFQKDAWRQLYQWLIRPIRQHLPKTADSLLTIVPHGPLFQVSFAGLLDENSRYLVERYRFHYTPAAAVLGFTGAKRSPAAKPPQFLLVADPAETSGADGKSLPALPGARREVRSIASLLAGAGITMLTGEEAREQSVRVAAAGKSVVHFATHGIVRNDDPSQSFLALTASGVGSPADGRLTSGEVYQLNLNADLVVLSACRSALGPLSSDGMIGLTRAFFYAGTPSIMATLWDVADEPTSRLVSDFYRYYRRDQDKSKALRRAQLRLIAALRSGRVKVSTVVGPAVLPEHPLFWASFILSGEP